MNEIRSINNTRRKIPKSMILNPEFVVVAAACGNASNFPPRNRKLTLNGLGQKDFSIIRCKLFPKGHNSLHPLVSFEPKIIETPLFKFFLSFKLDGKGPRHGYKSYAKPNVLRPKSDYIGKRGSVGLVLTACWWWLWSEDWLCPENPVYSCRKTPL